MRKISAHYIYCGKGEPVKFGVVSLNNRTVVAVSPPRERMEETAQTEFYPGILMPAIVNVTATHDNDIWYPNSDHEVAHLLGQQNPLPLFAVVTPQTVGALSAPLLQGLMDRGVMLTLGSPTDGHPVTLFRLMVKMAERLPHLPFDAIVKMATVNGAAAAEKKRQGSIEPNMEPGLYHVASFCFAKMSVGQSSHLNVLID